MQIDRHSGGPEGLQVDDQFLPAWQRDLGGLYIVAPAIADDGPLACCAGQVKDVRAVVNGCWGLAHRAGGQESAHVAGEHVHQLGQVILFRQPAALSQRGVVVVTGRMIAGTGRGQPAGPKAEVRPAMPHVIAKLRPAAYDLQGLAGTFAGISRSMPANSPIVEPAWPKLRYHHRGFGLHGAQLLQLLDAIAVTVDALNRAGHMRVVQHVAVDDRNIKPAAAEQLRDEFQVGQSFGHSRHVVFILVLDQDDVSAASYLKFRKFRQHLAEILVVIVRVGGVIGAIGDAGLGGQPGWQSAEIPFGTYIRPWPENDIQPKLAG